MAELQQRQFSWRMAFFAGPANAQSLIFLKSFKDFSRQRSQDKTGQVWNESGLSSRRS